MLIAFTTLLVIVNFCVCSMIFTKFLFVTYMIHQPQARQSWWIMNEYIDQPALSTPQVHCTRYQMRGLVFYCTSLTIYFVKLWLVMSNICVLLKIISYWLRIKRTQAAKLHLCHCLGGGGGRGWPMLCTWLGLEAECTYAAGNFCAVKSRNILKPSKSLQWEVQVLPGFK